MVDREKIIINANKSKNIGIIDYELMYSQAAVGLCRVDKLDLQILHFNQSFQRIFKILSLNNASTYLFNYFDQETVSYIADQLIKGDIIKNLLSLAHNSNTQTFWVTINGALSPDEKYYDLVTNDLSDFPFISCQLYKNKSVLQESFEFIM